MALSITKWQFRNKICILKRCYKLIQCLSLLNFLGFRDIDCSLANYSEMNLKLVHRIEKTFHNTSTLLCSVHPSVCMEWLFKMNGFRWKVHVQPSFKLIHHNFNLKWNRAPIANILHEKLRTYLGIFHRLLGGFKHVYKETIATIKINIVFYMHSI
jgi:hypothetical protein